SAFVEANYEVLESLLRERRRHRCNEDLRTKLEYFSEEYDKEREMEPRPVRVSETTPGWKQGRKELRRWKAFGTKSRGQQASRNESPPTPGGNLPPNSTHLSHNALLFIPNSLQPSNGPIPTDVNPYPQPNMGITYAPMSNNIPAPNGFMYPLAAPSNNYPSYTQPMYPLPNAPAYPNHGTTGLFVDSTVCVTPFVCWIEDYPLPDGLKMPSHVGSYDGKGDPDNYLHLFEGAIRMEKIGNARSLPYVHLYTDDTMHILGLHEEQRISGFVHGLKIRSLVESLSTYLLTTYNGQMEKTYTWIEAKEVATNGASNDHRESFDRFTKNSSWENNKGKKNRDRALRVGSKVLIISFSESTLGLSKRTAMQKIGIVVSTIHKAIKFHTPRGIGTIFLAYEPNKIEEGQKKFKEACLEIMKGVLSCVEAEERIVVNDKYPDQTIVIEKQLPSSFKKKLRDLFRSNINVFAWIYVDMTRIPRTITVGGKPFNIEHKLNEYKHITPVKQKKHGLGPDRSEATCKQVEELMKAGILRRIKNHLWIANRVMVKKSNGGWRVDQIGQNLEAYVDDMVIKSTSEEDMLKDIQETFDRFRSVNMKLSLKKFSFGVEEGPKSLPGLEKLILALVHTVRRLRRYFQAHLIRVLTDAPIKQTLINLDKLGRIAKWAIELGEHDIKFKGRDITLPFLTYSSGS
ncbi:hypothetical protein Tco_1248262, partial [Tanacetum coccineum]